MASEETHPLQSEQRTRFRSAIFRVAPLYMSSSDTLRPNKTKPEETGRVLSTTHVSSSPYDTHTHEQPHTQDSHRLAHSLNGSLTRSIVRCRLTGRAGQCPRHALAHLVLCAYQRGARRCCLGLPPPPKTKAKTKQEGMGQETEKQRNRETEKQSEKMVP